MSLLESFHSDGSKKQEKIATIIRNDNKKSIKEVKLEGFPGNMPNLTDR